MQKYSVKVGSQNEPILHIDGNMSRCPFTPPMMIPERMTGQLQISMIPCSLLCPHAKITENAEGKFEYSTDCTGSKTTMMLQDLQASLPQGTAPNTFLRTT
jgi:hypothetical protein